MEGAFGPNFAETCEGLAKLLSDQDLSRRPPSPPAEPRPKAGPAGIGPEGIFPDVKVAEPKGEEPKKLFMVLFSTFWKQDRTEQLGRTQMQYGVLMRSVMSWMLIRTMEELFLSTAFTISNLYKLEMCTWGWIQWVRTQHQHPAKTLS